MTKLSVNINKIATIRNARGKNNPDVIQVAQDCERFGAQGITVHPRPDERHIRYADVRHLKKVVTTEFNVEGNPTDRFIDLVLEVKPDQVTLVPDAEDAITSNAGWDTIQHQDFLTDIITELKKNNIRTSIFLDPEPKFIEGAQKTGTDRIEFYTEFYADYYPKDPKIAIEQYQKGAILAQKLGLGINAGHDLNLDNLRFLQKNMTGLLEVSIGHALVCDALYYGLENTIQLYLRQLN